MKKLFWLSVSVIVLVSLIFASAALATEKKVPVPDKPELVMRTKLYPQFGFFIHDCGIRRVEADGKTTTKELGRNIWLDLVCVEKSVSTRRVACGSFPLPCIGSRRKFTNTS